MLELRTYVLIQLNNNDYDHILLYLFLLSILTLSSSVDRESKRPTTPTCPTSLDN